MLAPSSISLKKLQDGIASGEYARHSVAPLVRKGYERKRINVSEFNRTFGYYEDFEKFKLYCLSSCNIWIRNYRLGKVEVYVKCTE